MLKKQLNPENFFDSFMKNSFFAAWVKDEELRYVYVNPYLERLMGKKSKAVVGKNDFDLWTKELAEQFQKNDRAALFSNKPVEVTEKTYTPDGVMHFWKVCKFGFKGADGRRYVGGQALDLTALKKAEEKVQFQNSVLDQVRNAVVIFDNDLKVSYWNKFSEKMYQWSAEEALGKNLVELVVPEHLKDTAYSNGIQQIMNEGYWEGEFTVRKKDGSFFQVFSITSALKDESGKVTAYLGIGVDMTDKIETQKALENKTVAFRELVSALDDERVLFAKTFQGKIETIVYPAVEKVKCKINEGNLKGAQGYLQILEQNLQNLKNGGKKYAEAGLSCLTVKERDICSLIRSGLSNKEIASALQLSSATVEVHRNNIRRKLGIQDRKLSILDYLDSL